MPRKQLPHVFNAQVALEQGLAQVPDGGHDHHDRAKRETPPEANIGEPHVTDETRSGDTTHERARKALPRLLRADARSHRVLAKQDPYGVTARVVHDGNHEGKHDLVRAVRLRHEKDREARHKRHPQKREDTRYRVPQRHEARRLRRAPHDEHDRSHDRGHEKPRGAVLPRRHHHANARDKQRDRGNSQARTLEGVRDLEGRDDDRDGNHGREQSREHIYASVQKRHESKPDGDSCGKVPPGSGRARMCRSGQLGNLGDEPLFARERLGDRKRNLGRSAFRYGNGRARLIARHGASTTVAYIHER